MNILRTLLILALGPFILSCATTPPKSVIEASEISSISPKEAQGSVLREQAILIDVREENEIKNGMAKPAQWMPLSRMNPGDAMWKEFLANTPKTKLVVSYCFAGRRAKQAAQKMKAEGYDVASMGGYSDWVNAGLPVRKPGNQH